MLTKQAYRSGKWSWLLQLAKPLQLAFSNENEMVRKYTGRMLTLPIATTQMHS
jgi:hypothetical protein